MRRREAIAAAGATLAVAGLLARPEPARAQDAREADVLARALRLEHTSVFACDAVAEAGVLDGEARRRLRRVRDHEAAHAGALARALAAMEAAPPAPPRTLEAVEVPQVRAGLAALSGRDDALTLLAGLERLSIEAYRAAVARLRAPDHVQLAATILAAEATHLAAWRTIG